MVALTFLQPITDTSIVKDVIILRPLTMAPPGSLVELAFTNQCAGLEEILDEDAKDRSLHPDTDSIRVNTSILLLYSTLFLLD